MTFLIGEAMTGGYGGADILRGCTIEVDKGEIAVIVGPNGAGKSSLLRAIYCHRYDQPASLSGQVMIAGHPVHKMNRRERACKIAVVLQESALPFEVSVREVLATGLTPRKPLLSFTSRDDTQLIERIAADLDVNTENTADGTDPTSVLTLSNTVSVDFDAVIYKDPM